MQAADLCAGRAQALCTLRFCPRLKYLLPHVHCPPLQIHLATAGHCSPCTQHHIYMWAVTGKAPETRVLPVSGLCLDPRRHAAVHLPHEHAKRVHVTRLGQLLGSYDLGGHVVRCTITDVAHMCLVGIHGGAQPKAACMHARVSSESVEGPKGRNARSHSPA
eukprot:363954-Chlamydomonas_euryale.AAC.3